MRVYPNRTEPEYLSSLRTALDLHGENGLLANAIPLRRPFEEDGIHFEKICRIDFVGIAATNLLDLGGNFGSRGVSDAIEELFGRVEEITSAGAFLRLRFLFLYPYSVSAISRIQAEATRHRSSIEEPEYLRKTQFVEQVDQESFFRSNLVRRLSESLQQIEDWVGAYGWRERGPNKVVVRFTPVHPSVCALLINNTVYFDPYTLAKQTRGKDSCTTDLPLLQISKGDPEYGEAFLAFEDHFRYLWELDVTLDCEDATRYRADRPQTLNKIKAPPQVGFEAKGRRFLEKGEKIGDEELHEWKVVASHLLDRLCTDTSPTPRSQNVFLACSWTEQQDQRMVPNTEARNLSRWLNEDLGSERPGGALLSVRVLQAATGEFLTRELYENLRQATLALVLLTADIEDAEGRFYSRPNVYHELGFLLRQLGRERVAIVGFEKVVIPSNVRDIVRVKFTDENFSLVYRDIIKWLNGRMGLSREVERAVLEQHGARLEELVSTGEVEAAAAAEGKKRLQEAIAALGGKGQDTQE